jgi:molybdenum cofactor cytidylyltransferase
MPMTVAGILLAAGQSRRFGKDDKLLFPLDGRPLATYSADALRHAGCSRLIAVVASDKLRDLLPGFEIVAPTGPASLSASLRAGLRLVSESEATHALFVLADMPFVTSDHLRNVIRLAETRGVAASASGTLRCPPACFHRSKFTDLDSLREDAGARAMLAGLGPADVVIASAQMLADIDRCTDVTMADRVSGTS